MGPNNTCVCDSSGCVNDPPRCQTGFVLVGGSCQTAGNNLQLIATPNPVTVDSDGIARTVTEWATTANIQSCEAMIPPSGVFGWTGDKTNKKLSDVSIEYKPNPRRTPLSPVKLGISCKTQDNKSLSADTSVILRIVDPNPMKIGCSNYATSTPTPTFNFSYKVGYTKNCELKREGSSFADKDGEEVIVEDTISLDNPQKSNTYILETSFPQTFSLKCEDYGDSPWGQQLVLQNSDSCMGQGTETSSDPRRNPKFEEI